MDNCCWRFFFHFFIFNFRSFSTRSKCMVLGCRYALCSMFKWVHRIFAFMVYIENTIFDILFSLHTLCHSRCKWFTVPNNCCCCSISVNDWWYSKANFHITNLIYSSFGSDKKEYLPCRAPWCVVFSHEYHLILH